MYNLSVKACEQNSISFCFQQTTFRLFVFFAKFLLYLSGSQRGVCIYRPELER